MASTKDGEKVARRRRDYINAKNSDRAHKSNIKGKPVNAEPLMKDHKSSYAKKRKTEAPSVESRRARLKLKLRRGRRRVSVMAFKMASNDRNSDIESHNAEVVKPRTRDKLRQRFRKIRRHVTTAAWKVANDGGESKIETPDASAVISRKRDKLKNGWSKVKRRVADAVIKMAPRMAHDDRKSEIGTCHAEAGTPRRQDHMYNGGKSKTSSPSSKAGFTLSTNINASDSRTRGKHVKIVASRKDKTGHKFKTKRDWEAAVPKKDHSKLHDFKESLKTVLGSSADGNKKDNSKRKSKTEACFTIATVAAAGAAADPSGTFLILAIIAVTLGCCGVAYHESDRFLCSLKSGLKKIKLLFTEREMTTVKMQLINWSLGMWKRKVGATASAPRKILWSFPTSAAASGVPSKKEVHDFLEAQKKKKEIQRR